MKKLSWGVDVGPENDFKAPVLFRCPELCGLSVKRVTG